MLLFFCVPEKFDAPENFLTLQYTCKDDIGLIFYYFFMIRNNIEIKLNSDVFTIN